MKKCVVKQSNGEREVSVAGRHISHCFDPHGGCVGMPYHCEKYATHKQLIVSSSGGEYFSF